MMEVAIVGLLVACLIAVVNWQAGINATLVVALLQDPFRKLVPGEPPYFILFAGVVFGAAIVGAISAKVSLRPRMVIGWDLYIAKPFQIFVLIVILQAVHSFVRYNAPLVPVLGLISYLGPFVALALTHAYAATTGSEGLRRLLLLYLVLFGIGIFTVYLEATGWDLQVFGEVGVGIRIHDFGRILAAHSGTFRASEIAAWHAATLCCVVIMLLTRKDVNLVRVLCALAIVAIIVSVGILTGRRKFVVTIAIFCIAYVALLALFWARARRVAVAMTIIGAFLYVGFMLISDPDVVQQRQANVGVDVEYQLYLQRTSGVFADVNERFLELGLAPVMWAYNWFGLLGGGLGIGTQGVQHMTQVGNHIGAAEGGLGKIMLELGLAGLIAVGLVAVAFMRHTWRMLEQIGRTSSPHLRLACGFAAILIANVANFAVATQVFGDVFVLLFLGLCLGSLMAMPRIIRADFELAQRAARRSQHIVRRAVPVRLRR